MHKALTYYSTCTKFVLKTRLQTLHKMSCDRDSTRYFENPWLREENKRGLAVMLDEFNLANEKQRVQSQLMGIVQNVLKNEPPQLSDPDGGLYVGAAGIGYMLLRISRLPTLTTDASEDYLRMADSYARFKIDDILQRGKTSDGFILGDAGVLATGAVIAKSMKNNVEGREFIRMYEECGKRCTTSLDYLSCGSDEFFVGRAGYIFGALWLSSETDECIPLDLLHEIAQTIIKSGRTNVQKLKNCPCPLMYSYYGTQYLGAAHGLCSILQALIQLPGFLDNDHGAEKDVRACVDYLLSLQTPAGNFPCALDEIDKTGKPLRCEEDELVHWCHGAPGVVYLMAAAYKRWKDERYLNSCLFAGELVWRKGLLRKGPGICHGVAGNGYVFLLLYRLTMEVKHLFRAMKFAQFLDNPMFKHRVRQPDNPYSLYEGISGTACFLADLLDYDKAAFPFQNVFLN